MSKFHLYKLDYTSLLINDGDSVLYLVYPKPQVFSDFCAGERVESLGAYESLETAVGVIKLDAEDFAVVSDDHFLANNDQCVAAYQLLGVMSHRETREEYGEWAYAIVHKEHRRDFTEVVRAAIRDAKRAEEAVPHEEALLALLEEYLESGPDDSEGDA